MNRDKLPLSWNKALLAIIPGLFATAGLVSTRFNRRTSGHQSELFAHQYFACTGARV